MIYFLFLKHVMKILSYRPALAGDGLKWRGLFHILQDCDFQRTLNLTYFKNTVQAQPLIDF